jgi:hypothetical protein
MEMPLRKVAIVIRFNASQVSKTSNEISGFIRKEVLY